MFDTISKDKEPALMGRGVMRQIEGLTGHIQIQHPPVP